MTREYTTERHGMRLWMRFTLYMTLALAVVMSIAGYVLYANASGIAAKAQEEIMKESVRLTGTFTRLQTEIASLQAQLDALSQAAELFETRKRDAFLQQVDPALRATEGRMDPVSLEIQDAIAKMREQKLRKLQEAQAALENELSKDVGMEEALGQDTFRYPAKYGPRKAEGHLYRFIDRAMGEDEVYDLVVPADANRAAGGLLKVIVWSTLIVILVGAGVSVFVASQVSQPIGELVYDIEQISKGLFNHRTKTGQGGEVGQLGAAINRMAADLGEARETSVALSVREREVALAGEVREALLSGVVPKLAGFDVAAAHIGSQDLGGDFQDFIQLADGRMGLLVCDVSGKGVPGAMVGSMARAYLRSELSRGGDVKETLRAVNREIARDIRRGMYVTALYALIDPRTGAATVACAGHKIPLLRWVKRDGKLRLVQPDGIALGFDKGPVFDRRLEAHDLQLESGDRLVLCNTGAVAVANPEGVEIGEKPLFGAIQKHAGASGAELLERVRKTLESHAGGNPFPRDVSIVTIARI